MMSSTVETNTSSHHFCRSALADVCAAQRKRRQSSSVCGYAHGPFFIMPSHVDAGQLVLQTIFLAVLFALVVNIPWPRREKDA
jgi:hypothetical protein